MMTQPITIGDSCWVGAQAFVGPGVTKGEGSRCLAGAVVVKRVEAGDTVGGVPASPKSGKLKAEKLKLEFCLRMVGA